MPFINKKIFGLLLLLIACESHDEAPEENTRLETETYFSTDFVTEIGVNNEPLFGDIADVSKVSDGKIVVLDNRSMAIHLLSDTGDLISTHSVEGRGPGEGQNLSHRLRTTDGNVFTIDDFMMYKISMFRADEGSVSHLTDIALGESINDYFLVNNSHFVVRQSKTLTDGEDLDSIKRVDVGEISRKRSIREFPAQKDITLKGAFGEMRFKINTSSKYQPTNEYCVDNDRLYHIRTDSLGVRAYSLNGGDEIFSVNYDQPAIQITGLEKELEVDEILSSGKELWGNSEKERLLSEMPDYKPQVKKVICDLPDGIWLELMNEEDRWILLNENGEIKGKLHKKMKGDIVNFDRGHIYVSNMTDSGEITLSVYAYSIDTYR